VKEGGLSNERGKGRKELKFPRNVCERGEGKDCILSFLREGEGEELNSTQKEPYRKEKNCHSHHHKRRETPRDRLARVKGL